MDFDQVGKLMLQTDLIKSNCKRQNITKGKLCSFQSGIVGIYTYLVTFMNLSVSFNKCSKWVVRKTKGAVTLDNVISLVLLFKFV